MPGPIHPIGVETSQFSEQIGANHPRSAGHRVKLEVSVALSLVRFRIGHQRHGRPKRIESPASLLQRPIWTDHLGPDHPSIGLHRSLD
jgi:hypothetical protein